MYRARKRESASAMSCCARATRAWSSSVRIGFTRSPSGFNLSKAGGKGCDGVCAVASRASGERPGIALAATLPETRDAFLSRLRRENFMRSPMERLLEVRNQDGVGDDVAVRVNYLLAVRGESESSPGKVGADGHDLFW